MAITFTHEWSDDLNKLFQKNNVKNYLIGK